MTRKLLKIEIKPIKKVEEKQNPRNNVKVEQHQQNYVKMKQSL